MKKLLIILVLFLTACNQENNGIYHDEEVTRWENEEVVCYIYRGFYKGGISCKWKENVAKPRHFESEKLSEALAKIKEIK